MMMIADDYEMITFQFPRVQSFQAFHENIHCLLAPLLVLPAWPSLSSLIFTVLSFVSRALQELQAQGRWGERGGDSYEGRHGGIESRNTFMTAGLTEPFLRSLLF